MLEPIPTPSPARYPAAFWSNSITSRFPLFCREEEEEEDEPH